MVAGLLGNESSDSNRFTLVTPKSENDVRLQATLGNQNPTGLPVGVVSRNADYIIDMGPEGGQLGGEIIATGTVEEIKQNKNSKIGKYL